jgi:uncharacterized membrane protein
MKHLAFGKCNFLLTGIGMLLVIVGFILMSGSGSTTDTFNPDIFSPLRIRVAPLVCLVGFVVIGISIVISPKETNQQETEG